MTDHESTGSGRRRDPRAELLALLFFASIFAGCLGSGRRPSPEARSWESASAADQAAGERDYERAIALYDKALRESSANPQAAYKRAVTLVKDGREGEFWPAMDEAVRRGYAFPWEILDEPALRRVRDDARFPPLLARIEASEAGRSEAIRSAMQVPDRGSVPSFASFAEIESAADSKQRALDERAQAGGSDFDWNEYRRLDAWRVAALRRYLDEHEKAPDRKDAAVDLVRRWAATESAAAWWTRATAEGVIEGADRALALPLGPDVAGEMRFVRAVAALRGVMPENPGAFTADTSFDLNCPAAAPQFAALAGDGGASRAVAEPAAAARTVDPWATRAAAYVAFCALGLGAEAARPAYARYRARPEIPKEQASSWDWEVRAVSREVRMRIEGADDFDAVTIDGRAVSLGSLRGKVVLVDFWSPG